MKYFLPLVFVLLLSTPSTAQVGKLIWQDEFNTNTLDTQKWSYETGTGVNGDWGTGQLDRATSRVENVSFQQGVEDADGGCLVITTQKEAYLDRNYTSGRINSAGKGAWGPGHRIVARVWPRDVLQKGQGFAFWMMPNEIPEGQSHIMWPQGGEIDIMEYVGSIPFNNLGTVHYAWFWENNEYRDWNHGHLGAYYNYTTKQVPNPAEPGYGNFPPPLRDPGAGSSAFHTYGIDWYENRIEFFVDDNVYHIHYLSDGGAYALDGQDKIEISEIEGKRVGVSEYSNHFEEWYPFEHDMYAILSAGVGGGQYTYGGAIVPDAEFPCSVFVDWVRVYELDGISLGTTDSPVKRPAIFPNPVREKLYVDLPNASDYRVLVSDMAGKTVLLTWLESSGLVNVSGLLRGTYLIRVSNGEFTVSQTIIKN